MADELPIILFVDQDELERWLEANHDSSEGIWLKIAKKGAREPSVTYAEALELALCFGWIDSQKRGHDDQHFLQRFTPRRPRGRWSKINRERAEELIAAGVVRPAGMAEIEAAKADGRWDAAYEGQRTAQVPDDLKRELDANPAAREFFGGLDSANRYAVIYRLNDAKKLSGAVPTEIPRSKAVEESLVGGIASLISGTIRAGEAGRAPELLPEMVVFLRAPFLKV